MNNWKLEKLGKYTKGFRGVSYNPYDLMNSVNDKATILLRSNNIKNGKVNYTDIQIVPTAIVSEAQKINPGDTIVCMSNGSKALVGKNAYCNFNLKGSAPVTIGAFCSVFKPFPEGNSRFISYILQSDLFQKHIDVILAGSAINNLKNSDIENFDFNFPPLPEQKKIAKILKTVDGQIEKTEAIIAKYKAIKQGLMQDLFTRGIDVATGKLRPSYQQAPELYKPSQLGMIPKEWDDLTFRDISTINQGLQIAITNRLKEEGENRFLYITIQYLNDPANEVNRFYIYNPTQSVICYQDDILMVRTGNTGMIVTNTVGAFHNNFFKINYNRSNNKNFIVYHLKREVIQNLILIAAGTTTIPDLKHSDFYKIPFPQPKKVEQELISKKLEAIDTKIEAESNFLLKVQKAKKGLMSDLLSGKVRVQVDEEAMCQ